VQQVDELHEQYPDLIKWAWSDMQPDSQGDVVSLPLARGTRQ